VWFVRVRTLSRGFFCSSILILGISGLTLSQGHAPALVAVLGVVAVCSVPTVIALALCRAAAAGDRAVVDGVQRAAVRVGPELGMAPRVGQGQRNRQGITPARESAKRSASTTRRATARPPARF